MSNEKWDFENLTPAQRTRLFNGCALIVGIILLAIGLGTLIHPGLGWLLLALFCIYLAYAEKILAMLGKAPAKVDAQQAAAQPVAEEDAQ